MASKNIAACLVLVLCALQDTNAGPATELFDTMNTTMNNIQQRIAEVRSNAAATNAKIQSQIEEALRNFAVNVDETIKRAVALGANITSCTKTAESELSSVLAASSAAIENCVVSSNNALNLTKLQVLLQSALQVRAEGIQQYSACSNFICQGAVKVSFDIKATTVNVQAVTELAKLLAQAPITLAAYATCAFQQADSTISGIQAVYVNEEQCLQAAIVRA